MQTVGQAKHAYLLWIVSEAWNPWRFQTINMIKENFKAEEWHFFHYDRLFDSAATSC